MPDASSTVSQLLDAWSEGDPKALDQLMPLVYDELRRIARRYLHVEPSSHMLQPSALVNELYIQLKGRRKVQWQSRAEFFGVAATVMRRILVDGARRRQAEKRGGKVLMIPFDYALALPEDRGPNVIALDDALKDLAKIDSRQSRIVELRFFGGLEFKEIAEVERMRLATVGREWETARSWLRRELTSTNHPNQLLARTREALRALGEVDAELERQGDRPPQPGDLFVFSGIKDLEWAVIERSEDGCYVLVVPADTDPQVGSADILVPAPASVGPLTLRCRFESWVEARAFDPEMRTGLLEAGVVDRVRRKRAEIESGTLTASLLEEEVDIDREYGEREQALESARLKLTEARAQADGGGSSASAPMTAHLEKRPKARVASAGGGQRMPASGRSAMTPDRQRQFMEILAGGDRETIFRELFDLWRRPILAFFRRQGFSEEDCRDFTQETFLRFCRGIDGFRGDSRVDAWLYEIANNVRAKEIRRRSTIQRSMKEASLEALPTEPPVAGTFPGRPAAQNPEAELLDKVRRDLVSAEVKKMPPKMRTCYELWAEGFKFREIAVLMGITIDALRGHLGEAKARLKRRLGDASDREDS